MKAWKLEEIRGIGSVITTIHLVEPHIDPLTYKLEEGRFFTLQELQAHNEKIARAAFEAGWNNRSDWQSLCYKYPGADDFELSQKEYLASDEYKKLVGDNNE